MKKLFFIAFLLCVPFVHGQGSPDLSHIKNPMQMSAWLQQKITAAGVLPHEGEFEGEILRWWKYHAPNGEVISLFVFGKRTYITVLYKNTIYAYAYAPYGVKLYPRRKLLKYVSFEEMRQIMKDFFTFRY